MTDETLHAPRKDRDTDPPEMSGLESENEGLSQLLKMSHALKHTLEPVKARTSFVKQLQGQLISNVENARLIVQSRRERRRQLKWTAIGAGGAIYLVTLGIILTRITRWGLNRLRNSEK